MRLYISCLAENIHVSFSDKHFASSVNRNLFAMVGVKCTWGFSGFINMQQGAAFGRSFPFRNIDYYAIFSWLKDAAEIDVISSKWIYGSTFYWRENQDPPSLIDTREFWACEVWFGFKYPKEKALFILVTWDIFRICFSYVVMYFYSFLNLVMDWVIPGNHLDSIRIIN